MALAPLSQELELNESQRVLRHQFFEATGYGSNDILSLNYETHIFLTFNGGKYQLVDGEVKYLAGPPVDVEDRMEL